jgi:hypothetical protein
MLCAQQVCDLVCTTVLLVRKWLPREARGKHCGQGIAVESPKRVGLSVAGLGTESPVAIASRFGHAPKNVRYKLSYTRDLVKF